MGSPSPVVGGPAPSVGSLTPSVRPCRSKAALVKVVRSAVAARTRVYPVRSMHAAASAAGHPHHGEQEVVHGPGSGGDGERRVRGAEFGGYWVGEHQP